MESSVNENPINMKFGVLGYGEVGRTFIAQLINKKKKVYVYDSVINSEEGESIKNQIKSIGAIPVESIEELVGKCEVFFSMVNSGSSIEVASQATKYITDNDFIFIDFTTSTPLEKKESESYFKSNKGKFIDAAIMGTVATQQYKVPLLLSGEKGKYVAALLSNIEFNCEFLDTQIGGAASIKLLRSIFMKGLEGLVIETMRTAQKYKVSDEVMRSISDTINDNNFSDFANALIQTHEIHKVRRLKEIQDSRKLITDAQITPLITDGVIKFFEESVSNVDGR